MIYKLSDPWKISLVDKEQFVRAHQRSSEDLIYEIVGTR